MGRAPKNPEPEEEAGAPEWMVTFSDCMTLLLTFFVLLLSFSSFDDKVFRRLKIIYCEALPRISLFTRSERDALLPPKSIINPDELDRGSEKPTLEEGEEGSLKKTKSGDFQQRRVLLIPSKRIFWGNGTSISSEGHKIMTPLASFLKRTKEQVVISETGPPNNKNNGHLGLSRAWAVMEYLTIKQNLDKKRFNISQAGTLPQVESSTSRPGAERMLEIVLLERSICN